MTEPKQTKNHLLQEDDLKWHSLSAGETLRSLEVNPETGLDSAEYAKRRERFGANLLTSKKGQPGWLRFLLQFHQPLVYILLAASLTTLLLKEWVDSGVIFGVVLVNAIIGYIQESKALAALDALSRTMTTRTTVLRDGRETLVDSAELVPGDVVLIASGDKVPADMRIFQSRELQVDESALTGESLPVQKRKEPLPQNTVLADRVNMLYASALVTYGQARAVVTATGDKTEVGRISQLISAAENLATPLTRKIAQFSHFLLYVILGMAAMTFLVGVLRGQSAVEMFMAAVALAVGAIPEGLPAAVTITLAIGVSRMAKRRAIVRKLPAVETLGSTMIICSDKTGTLTENQMTVQEIFAGAEFFEVTGNGYSLEGQILKDKQPVEMGSFPALKECLLAGLLCNDARLIEKNGRRQVEGDPTEGALRVAALKGIPSLEAEAQKCSRTDSLPFESEYQYMATLHDTGDEKGRVVYLKGAVEKILERCESALGKEGSVGALDKESVLKASAEMAAKGLRVLAFAYNPKPDAREVDHALVSSGMVFLGLQAMMDPPRAEAIQAVKNCHSAGIRVKMITGDHVITASAIAKQLGLEKMPAGRRPTISSESETGELVAVSGREMESFSNEKFEEMADKAVVFARVTPEQKLKLVRALQSRGNVVAMTGDGVNDAPALKQANIGISMGLGGTEVAKEAADMVLTDDNFASIVAAVEEGRCVFDNLRKFIVWTLPTNMGEGLVILTAIFLGTALPIIPVQILWINMTTAVALGLMLAFEPKEPDIMKRLPRDPQKPIMTRGVIIRTIYVGFFLVAGAFGLFMYEQSLGASVEQARTVAACVFVMGELFYLFNCRSLSKSAFQLGFFSNAYLLLGVAVMILLQLFFTYSPLMNKLFESVPIGFDSWLRILGVSALLYTVVGLEKYWRRSFPRFDASAERKSR